MSQHKKHHSGNSLMDLRLAILRVIAMVWESDHQGGNLRHHIVSKDAKELNDYFQKELGFRMPFENFAIDFFNGGAEWNFYGDHQWVKPNNETIQVTIPTKPLTRNDDEKSPQDIEYINTEKLMEYYSHFPSLFGTALRKKVDAVEGGGGEGSTSATDVDMAGNNYNLGVSEDPFLGFGAVMSKVIAVAWHNPKFMDSIVYKEGDDLIAYSQQLCALLEEHFDYTFPWAFNLKIVTPSDDESFWDEDGQWRERNKYGRALIRNSVHLEIPNTPNSENTSDVSLALARYNTIGPAYPFTCS